MEKVSVEILVSRYAEDVSWLSTITLRRPFRITIVNKGKSMHSTWPVVQMKNVGRCDHTYVHHFYTRFDSLEDVTLCIPASAYDIPVKRAKLHEVLRRLEHQDSVFPLRLMHLQDIVSDRYTSSHKNNGGNQALLKAGYGYDEWWQQFIGVDQSLFCTLHGIFAVERKSVQRHGKAFWGRLEEELSKGDNLEAGHFMERAWYSVLRGEGYYDVKVREVVFLSVALVVLVALLH
jgi:hypothetical protein